MSIYDAMSRIQPESELKKCYSNHQNTSGQLHWGMDATFRAWRLNRGGFGEYYSDLIAFFFDNGMLFEFCLAVEGCKTHNLDHNYKWCEEKVAQSLDKVRK